MALRKKKTTQPQDFERSSELKRLFNELSEVWCRSSRLGMADLAERCGVSLQYLSHIGRYGRIPSKPILTLLAFNLSSTNPDIFFRAAGMLDAWPYEPGLGLRARSASDSGLLSINLDMNGFTQAIREIVRAEIQPKRVEILLGNRPLRVGLNRGQFFLFNKENDASEEGFFPDLVRALVLSLHCELEFVEVPHLEFDSRLNDGTIDCYGPIYRTAPRIGHGLFSKPFCRVAAVVLGRSRAAKNLEQLPPPKRFADLKKRDYVIAVHRGSMAHHFAAGELGIPESRIIPCDAPEEAVERIVLTSMPRPAHVMITDAPYAAKVDADHPTTTAMLLSSADGDAPPFEDTLAIRSDWPELLALVNETLEYLRTNRTLDRLLERTVNESRKIGVYTSQ